MATHKSDLISGIVNYFARSKITPLIIVASMLLGLFAVFSLPREEEPQISVPMFDIFVSFPGASAEEVERRIINLGERKLWELTGVEYLYSTAEDDKAFFTVRFKVGEDVEKSLIKLYTKVYSNLDILPAGASQPLIKLRSIDDVPILSLTFFSHDMDPQALRKTVASIQNSINAIPDVSETSIIGGRKRQFQVFFDQDKLRERILSPQEIAGQIQNSNVRVAAGHIETEPELINVETDAFFKSKSDLENLVVGVSQGAVVYLKDVANVVDGPDENENYVDIRVREHGEDSLTGPFKAVTLAVSKRKGSNAAWLSEKILQKIDGMKGREIPQDVEFKVTRDYGETATEKSNELLLHMMIAVVGVAILIAFVLGFRESGVVAVAIPMTLALTLAVFYFLGFTLNRITLFALIFSIGILVDDPIVDVENIVRHLRMPRNKGKSILDVTIEAVNEVRSPLILATLTVIAAILPMAFVRGLMGPYMRPIPIGASIAMMFSMAVAFIATPWAAYTVLGRAHIEGKLKGHGEGEAEDLLTRIYRSYMRPLIYSEKVRFYFLLGMGLLLFLAVLLVPLKLVKVKMLPFDNKNEFQVILNMPEGTAIEVTKKVLGEIAEELAKVKEVDNIETYAGTSSPYNFNGLVRHYFLRSMPNQGDLQVNLVGKHHRKRQSHAIAKSVRPDIHKIVEKYGGRVQVAEVPPGPPVLSTLVLEVYGPDLDGQVDIAGQLEEMMKKEKGITDVDTYVRKKEQLNRIEVNIEKATLNGISVRTIAEAVSMAVNGKTVDLAHIEGEYEPLEIMIRLPKKSRGAMDALMELTFLSRTGTRIPLKDLVTVKDTVRDRAIYHKNLMRVSYVLGDVAGDFESPVYAIIDMGGKLKKLKLPMVEGKPQKEIKQLFTSQPENTDKWQLKWDGEWQITYEVFRDLGLAFAAVLILIYVLVVGWFQSYKTPLIIMLPIPLTLIGILPAHWMTNMFFTATSMIGLIAGAGIVVRNSIILVDFIELRAAEGMTLEEAVIDAGAKRFRPMLLTAAAVVVGASVILVDPIFQGLALALISGEVASTLLSRTAVPVIYYMVMRKKVQ